MADHVVILAGGRGERFWPRSTPSLPKQFIRLFGQRTLLQEALLRARALVPEERIWVASAAEYEGLLRGQLPADLVEKRLVLEPVRRDTAAGIGWAALHVLAVDPEAVLVMMPADHYLADLDAFAEAVGVALRAARRGSLVTLGIRPSRPETGYGYIRLGRPLEEVAGAYHVDRFVEKPEMETALRFLQEGTYLWNSGIFVWQARSILDAIGRRLPELRAGLERAWAAPPGERPRLFAALPAISVDYGVMQDEARLGGDVVTAPGRFTWDDVGSWAALDRLTEADDRGNRVLGEGLALAASGCTLHNEEAGHPLIAFGTQDLLMIHTARVTVVAPKARAADWKELLAALRRAGYGRLVDDVRESAPVDDGRPGATAAPLPAAASPARGESPAGATRR
ncbi:MAG: mannose-1-phosphate guanylyltransferase [Bacillota bacterium]|nr:mannose-1-phosphate guanylyltransferase [Bacillota bacterium]